VAAVRRALFASFAAAGVLAAAACNTDFAPASEVSSLRILGVRAVPAEPRPGTQVTLEALVVDPTRPDAGSATLWLGCAPTADTTTSPCSNTDALLSLTGGDAGLPEGVSMLGLGTKITTQVPANVFPADAGTDTRQEGVLASAVIISAAAPQPATPAEVQALLEKVQRGEVAKQVALFRYPVSESDNPNHDPVLEGFLLSGETVPPGATVRIPAPDASVDLLVPDASFEPYVQQAPAGNIDQVERLAARYYATPSVIVDTEAVEVRGSVVERLGPGDAGLAQPDGHLWAVVRDSRGGQSWIDGRTVLCDGSLPAPSASAVSTDGGTVMVSGTALGSVADLQLGERILPGTECTPSACTAPLGGVDAGSYSLTLRARSCTDVATGLTVTVP
jgi:hypothetical protein